MNKVKGENLVDLIGCKSVLTWFEMRHDHQRTMSVAETMQDGVSD